MKVRWERVFTDEELMKLSAKLKPSPRANSRKAKREEVRGWLDTLVKDGLAVLSPARQRLTQADVLRAATTARTPEFVASDGTHAVEEPKAKKLKPKKGWKCPGCNKWKDEPIARRCAACRGTKTVPADE